MNTKPMLPIAAQADTARKPWTVPAIEVMRAGDAEAGPTPINPEGAFAFGS